MSADTVDWLTDSGSAVDPHTFTPERFKAKLVGSRLKAPVQGTLEFMLGWTNLDGWTCISNARIAEATGKTRRTIRNHWNTARSAGYLRSFDYPMYQKRTSDHWLTWPGRFISTGCPGLDAVVALSTAEGYWESFDRPINSPGPPPF